MEEQDYLWDVHYFLEIYLPIFSVHRDVWLDNLAWAMSDKMAIPDIDRN